MPEPEIPLSVVIATTQPWPESRACLDSVHEQAQAVGAEIVLAHSLDEGFPPGQAERYPAVVALPVPGASANELRGVAFEHVRGAVVAITEDHCFVTDGWCEGMLRAHREHSDAAAVGGVVENGATGRMIDRASFFLANAAAMAPVADGPTDKIAAQANVSYKRWALPERAPGGGFFELDHNADLLARGHELVADSRVVAYHDQSLGFWGTCTVWFHAARTWTGTQARDMTPPARALAALRVLVTFPGGSLLHVRRVWAKGRERRWIVATGPLMALLSGLATVGSAVGYATGAGDSPRHIR